MTEPDAYMILFGERREHRCLVDGPRYTPNETEVLKLLDVAGGMTAPQVGDALGISRQSAYERLNRMKSRGLIRFFNDAWQLTT